MGVSKNTDTPKWMVYNGKPYFLLDDLGGNTPIFRNTHMFPFIKKTGHCAQPSPSPWDLNLANETIVIGKPEVPNVGCWLN